LLINKAACQECSRLWREYQNATTSHIHLCGKHRIAELQYDKAKAAQLAEVVEEAGQERQAARDAIRQHEADVHGVHMDASGDACGAGE
jgi:hypothetical protein